VVGRRRIESVRPAINKRSASGAIAVSAGVKITRHLVDNDLARERVGSQCDLAVVIVYRRTVRTRIICKGTVRDISVNPAEIDCTAKHLFIVCPIIGSDITVENAVIEGDAT
jgi:precorrin-4 methylase